MSNIFQWDVELPSGLVVTVIHDDIINVKAGAVVTGEGPTLERESFVTKALQKVSPSFKDIRDALKKKCHDKVLFRELNLWTVRISELGIPFNYVIHAVLVAQVNDGRIYSDWVKDMKTLYRRIFAAAERLPIRALAVPLLGTGAARTDKKLAINALVESILKFCPKYINKIMIVHNDLDIVRMIIQQLERSKESQNNAGKDIFSTFCSKFDTFTDKFSDFFLQPVQQVRETNIDYSGKGKDREADENERRLQEGLRLSIEEAERQDKTTWFVDSHIQKSVTHPRSRGNRVFCGFSPQSVQQVRETDIDYSGKRKDREADENERRLQEGLRLSIEEAERQDKTTWFVDSQESVTHPSSRNTNLNRTFRDASRVPTEINYLADEEHEFSMTRERKSSAPESIYSGLSTTDRNGHPNYTETDADLTCPICLSPIMIPKQLDKCGHIFCEDCIERCFRDFKPVCPSCNMVYGVITGNQPDGTMDVGFSSQSLPGYSESGTITITYNIPSGIQKEDHPSPGQPFTGTTRRAYLPDCQEGKAILTLLKIAFDRKLTFTIGRSTTTGRDGVVTWNDIHHKTNMDGGPTRYGYPDPTYLSRVREELANKGVTDAKL